VNRDPTQLKRVPDIWHSELASASVCGDLFRRGAVTAKVN